jgi:WD40 repeat protein
MARICRHRGEVAGAFALLASLFLAPAFAEDQGPNAGTDLYDRPVLVIDPRVHTAAIWSQAVDRDEKYAVTGGADRTVRIWSVGDGKPLGTIWIPTGPEKVGLINAVAISPDGSSIAAGGWTEGKPDMPIYIFDRESGDLVRRIHSDLPNVAFSLAFSPDGRYLAVGLGGPGGLRVFDRDNDWSEVFRDDRYGDSSYGAAFAPSGRLAMTSEDGGIRLYAYDPESKSPNFRLTGAPMPARSGRDPMGIAFSPDGNRLAVGYSDVAAVDVLDGATLQWLGGQKPSGVTLDREGLKSVAWSPDGQTLLAAGAVHDYPGRRILFAWDRGGLGGERRLAFCGPSTASGLAALSGGRILVASMAPSLCLMGGDSQRLWTVGSPTLDFSAPQMILNVSPDGNIVDFTGYIPDTIALLRFDLRSLRLSNLVANDGATLPPIREGLNIDKPLSLRSRDSPRSLAIAVNAKRFFLGSAFALTAFDDAEVEKWRWSSRSEVWAVNATKDGRIVVAAYQDGMIRWHRADDGHELLALQVLPNGKEPAKWDWVLWTPEGFYEATPGTEDVLKWVTNHGPDSAASVLPVSAIAELHRPDALPHVLDQLETAHALGVDDMTQARLIVQAKTGSAKPPGGVLHVLAIGLNKFGDKAGGLHLDYAAEDAHDVASALFDSQKGGPGKASLYADVRVDYLLNEQATHTAILDRLDVMAQSVAKSDPDQDLAVILVSSHGEIIEGKFYLIPYGFDLASPNASRTSALPANEFAEKIAAIAAHAKVLLLLDACHSGAVGAQGWATDPDAKILQDVMNRKNVTVLTSSGENELSVELPEWKHGALAEAFLDALKGTRAPKGIIRVYPLIEAMDNEVRELTKGHQHLGTHPNFNGDLFVTAHY